MKAAQISSYGHADAVKINDVDTPAPGENQVLVEVHANSLNPFDTSVREGYINSAPLEAPMTLGGDFAGVITELGSGVTDFAVGDTVYGQAYAMGGTSGAFAEYATSKAASIAHMPKNVSFEEAAALALVGVSALQALTEHIGLQSGQKILIHGGSGGIGSMAIQIAKNIGAYVATTVPESGKAYVKEIGADEVIDYKNQDFTTLLNDYDAVFDTTRDMFERSLSVLKPGGVYVSMAGGADDAKAKEHSVTAINQHTQVTTDRLDKLRELVEAGIVKVHIDTVFPLDQIQQAFEKREAGGVTGKIVLEVKK